MQTPATTPAVDTAPATAVDGERDLIAVTGPDAATYLQGQLSQEIEALATGTSTRSLLLEPQGKVAAWFRITRVADDTFWLDLEAGHGEAAVVRLQRFLLRTKAEISLSTVKFREVRGAHPKPPSGVTALDVAWPGVDGYDLLGDDVAKDDTPNGDPAIFEAARIRSGRPLMGAELTEKTIPAEAGVVEQSVSFTKGCYVGQELVARVDSRGNNTPRNLRGVEIDGPAPAVGASLTADGEAVGAITSVSLDPAGGSVALAYIKRGTALPLKVDADGVEATVVELPF